ncbi:glyoxylate/hydroxypyruvate reductase A [bacterium]|nr:glyoxylate/hydroxypyruvate reductase A [bacterium]
MNIVFHSTHFERSEWQQAFTSLNTGIQLRDMDDIEMSDVDVLLVWKPGITDWRAATNLQCVVWLGAGVDVTNTGLSLPPNTRQERLHDGGMREAMCDYALYAVLHYQRRFDIFAQAQRQQQWIHERDYRKKSDMSLGVLGFGHLGRAVAEYLASMGYCVSAWSRSARTSDSVVTYAGLDTLEHFLNQSPILINMLPQTPETHHLLDETRLSQLPSHSALISLSRGAVIDTQALLRLIDNGHLRGAFMDVFEQEPLSPSSPLWHHPNITMTPHQSAPTQVLDSAQEIAKLVAEI